jgi:hypothetical protein
MAATRLLTTPILTPIKLQLLIGRTHLGRRVIIATKYIPRSRLISRSRPRLFSTSLPRNSRQQWEHEQGLQNAQPLVTKGSFGRFAKRPSTHAIVAVSFLAAVAFYFSNLQTVPVSGRKRFNCFSDSEVETLGQLEERRILYELEQQGGRFLSEWDPRHVESIMVNSFGLYTVVLGY